MSKHLLTFDDDSEEGPMRLTVLGPSGGTGRQLIRQALTAGHQVRVIARRPETVAELTREHPGLDARSGDVLDPAWAGAGIAGADAVLSALGTDLRRPTTLYSAGTAAVLGAMAAAGVSRLVAVTATPAGPDWQKPFTDRYLVHPLLNAILGPGYADMRRMEELLARSSSDWTVFRPPRLTNGPESTTYRTTIGKPLQRAWSVSRATLAAAMLAAISDQSLSRRAVTIAD